MFDVVSTVANMILTALLSAFFVFLSLRWVFSKMTKGLSGLTSLGGQMAGLKSGDARAERAVRGEAAESILNSPQIQGVKMIAGQFGFDIDGMVKDHGAEATLSGLIQVMQMVGIDPQKLLVEGISGVAKGLFNKGGSGGARSFNSGERFGP